MGKLGVGIIGCGWVAGEYIKAFCEDERSEIRALVSRRRPENAQRYCDAHDFQCAIETDPGGHACHEGHRTLSSSPRLTTCTRNMWSRPPRRANT